MQHFWTQSRFWAEIQYNYVYVWKTLHLLGSSAPIDVDCKHFIGQFHRLCGINAREYFHPVAP